MSEPQFHNGESPASVRPRQHVAGVSRAAATYKRKKTTSACQVCRVRRTKCDEARPCSYCRTNGHECISSSSDSPHWDPATLHILERIDGLELHLAGLSRSLVAVLPGEPSVNSPASVQDHDCRVPLSLHPQNLAAVLQWEPLKQLQDASSVAASSRQAASLVSRANLVPSPSSPPSPDLEYPTCRSLINAFFTYTHPKNPILNETEVRTCLKQACFDGFRWDAEHALLLLLLANGALATDFGADRQPTSQCDLDNAHAFFTAAQKRFSSHSDSASYLLQAKYLFYSGVYLMSILRPFDAWRAFLQALSACQALPSLLAWQTDSQRPRDRDEESLYWSCWKSERELKNELGLADFATGLDHPQMYPSLPTGCEGENLKAWYFYLAEISLWRLETSAKNDFAGATASSTMTVLENLALVVEPLQEQLRSWRSSLPPELSLDRDPEDQEPCVLRFVLQGRLTYNLEQLTWPFLHAVLHFGQRSSLRTQQLAKDGLYHHLERLVINRLGFSYRHHGTWLMMRSSARSACILLAAALKPDTAALLPHAWTEPVCDAIAMLEFWNSQGGGLDAVTEFLRRELAKCIQPFSHDGIP